MLTSEVKEPQYLVDKMELEAEIKPVIKVGRPKKIVVSN